MVALALVLPFPWVIVRSAAESVDAAGDLDRDRGFANF